MALFYSFANVLSAWLNRKQLDSHICFFIQSVVLVEIYGENLALHRYAVEKKYINSIFRYLQVFFFENTPILNKQQFLPMWNLTYQLNFCSFILKSISISCILNGSIHPFHVDSLVLFCFMRQPNSLSIHSLSPFLPTKII